MEVTNPNPGKESVRVTVTAEDLKQMQGEAQKPAEGAPQGNPTADVTPPADGAPVRPEWVPEEYWDAEKGVANYEAMAKALAEKNAKPADEQPPKDETPPNADAAAALRDKATAEFEKDGKLTEETYAAYEKLGVTREQIDGYIYGMQARAELAQYKAHGEVGGKDKYDAMIEWARTALTPDEIAAYDRAVNSFDDAAMLNAVRGLAARFRVEGGTEGNLLATTTARPASGDLFESKAQLVAAMSDKRYHRDAGYRAEVQAKLQRSIVAGKQLGI